MGDAAVVDDGGGEARGMETWLPGFRDCGTDSAQGGGDSPALARFHQMEPVGLCAMEAWLPGHANTQHTPAKTPENVARSLHRR